MTFDEWYEKAYEASIKGCENNTIKINFKKDLKAAYEIGRIAGYEAGQLKHANWNKLL